LAAIIETGLVNCIGDTLMLVDIKDLLSEVDGSGTGGVINEDEILRCGDLRLDIQKREVYLGCEEVELTKMLFDLLELFLRNLGNVITRDDITSHLRNDPDAIVEESTTNAHVMKIRRKIGKYGKKIKTIRGIGYKMYSL
jgi:DNA-binding response OmpR family regulator